MTEDNDKLKPDPEGDEPPPSEEGSPSEETTPAETDEDASEASQESPETEAEDTSSVDAPETLYEPPDTPEPKDKQPRSGGGVLSPILIVLMLALAGGGYFLFQEQKKFEHSVLTRLTQLESQVNTIQSGRDLSETNAQKLDGLSRQISALKTQTVQKLESHQNTVSTLDEDILNIRESLKTLQSKVAVGPSAGPTTEAPVEETDTEEEEEEIDSSAVESVSPSPPAVASVEPEETGPERSEDAKEYIEFVETTTEKLFRLAKEGFIKLWDWFIGLF